jgi:GWxTD domain-containing protein
MVKILSILLLLLTCSIALFSQEVVYENYNGQVEIWVLIPYNTLSFKKGFDKAEYQVSMQIRNSKKKQVANFEQKINIPKRNWLEDTAIPVHLTQNLAPGPYSAELKLKNRNLGDKRNVQKHFVVGDKNTEIGLSWVIVKREGISYIPNSLKHLDSAIEKVLLQQNFSLELDSIRVQIDKHRLMITNPRSPIELDILPYLSDDASNTLKITMYEKNIHYALDPFYFSPWYSYSLIYSKADQMAQLRYIATQNEWQILRQVPDEKQSQAIESYWNANDPSPGTIRNETREKFYQRVLKADEMFTIHKKLKGWASDRGRIYIKFGEPDEITTDVHPIGRYPNITWTYYKQNKEFYFADVKGYGQYILRNKEAEYDEY